MSAGDESARPAEGLLAPNSPGEPVRNPAQVSFWLLEPVADAAMTYFYAQLFAMDTEIRAMFPAAMDVQRRRFFDARRHQDLYDLPALQETELIYPWLRVIPAVSDEPAHMDP
jgi:hypothetical protein